MSERSNDLLRLTANTIRGLSMDAVEKAGCGHPGLPMGMADVASVLWLEFLRYSPKDPQWRGRDRFVLSAGHGSMLLYSMLHLADFDLSIEDLRNFRQLHSQTPGHPEYGVTPGVETTTGPLGQGFANGVGMALAARMEAAHFANSTFDTRVFGIVSDGDLMEGLSAESASIAGHLGLSNLVYLYDDNHITIAGETDLAFSEDVPRRFESMGWRVLHADGHDYHEIRRALQEATDESERPTLVVCRTHIGYGSPNKVDSAAAHGAALGADEVAATKVALGLPAEEFWVPDEVRSTFAEHAIENETLRTEWMASQGQWREADPERAATHDAFLEQRIPETCLDQLIEAAGVDAAATRVTSGKVLQQAAELVPSLIGGSADLEPSTKTTINSSGAVRKNDYAGRNIHFGVREHAMGSIANGMALHGGFLPITSTFMVFHDYMRPAVRLAALMGIRAGFVYTHDSLMVGEDGPTHQPIEHLAALRSIPNLHVFRPADGHETAAAWTHLLQRHDGPVALSLTRQNVPVLDRPEGFQPADMLRGGYALLEPSASPQAIIIATGAEVSLALATAKSMAANGIVLRVVSMPCVELFLSQDAAYQQSLLPAHIPTIAVEMGRPEPWCQFTGNLDNVLGVSTFGASAPADVLTREYGFTSERLTKKIEAALTSAAPMTS